MAILTEVLGLMVPSGACAPAVSSEKKNSRKNSQDQLELLNQTMLLRIYYIQIECSCNSLCNRWFNNGLMMMI